MGLIVLLDWYNIPEKVQKVRLNGIKIPISQTSTEPILIQFSTSCSLAFFAA